MSAQALGKILQHPSIWRARDERLNTVNDGIPTGHAELDTQLPGGGWPKAGLTEILNDQSGIGEMQLVMPTLARLSQDEDRWIVLINAPQIPYAPALRKAGVQLDRLLWVRTRNEQETLWATHQALESGTPTTVLSWIERDMAPGITRRLQVAATDGENLGFLFRPKKAAQQPSGAMLRLSLCSENQQLQVEITKRRGSWHSEPFSMESDTRWAQRIQAKGKTLARKTRHKAAPVRHRPHMASRRTNELHA